MEELPTWLISDAVWRGLRKHLPPEAFAGHGFWADREPSDVPDGKVITGEVLESEPTRTCRPASSHRTWTASGTTAATCRLTRPPGWSDWPVMWCL